ncbi:MAG: hypothetical protein JNG90_05235 [Planctomycetaceae bacterium]|nr:hypothetical protein [Planctomycetaceae bacterium]
MPAEPILVESSKTLRFDQELRPTRLTRTLEMAECAWQPQRRYTLTSPRKPGSATPQLVYSGFAPQSPTQMPLWQIPLEDVRDAAAGGTWPDCCLQFSPDGRYLAIGSFAGWLRIVDCSSGELLWSQRLAEGMVKRVAWAPEGKRLYAGEQSPDGRLLAFDVSEVGPGKLAVELAWSVRLAEQLESSRPPAHDRFGIYTLPAVYDLAVVDPQRVFVAGTHRWSVDGQPQSRSLLACYDRAGQRLWQFPRDRPTAESWGFTFFAVDAKGTRVVALAAPGDASSSARNRAPARLVQLDGRTGELVGECSLAPLEPHFERVESWDSISLSAAGDRAVVGLNDGRALLFQLTTAGPQLLREIPLATPELVGQTPIVAAASYARFHGDILCLQTQNTHIPFGNSQAANRPPIAHRGANTLTVCDADGNPQWLYRGPFSLSGSWADSPGRGDPRWLVVACREEPGAREPGNFGLLVFDLRGQGSGLERLVYYYATEGPAMFSADISRDGRYIAVAETPTPTPDGRELYGTYQVHILH